MSDSKIHELLNLSWGGPGFASYEGRLEDDGGDGPMDSQSRAEAALAAFSGDGEADDEADAGADEGDDAAAGEGEGEAAGEGEGEGAAEGQLTDEQRQADPVFQELTTFREEVNGVFDKHGISAAAESTGTTVAEQADLQLSDANVLYSIMNGKGTPSQLLDAMVANTGWQKPQIDAVASDLMGWLKKQGYLKGDAAAGAGKGAGAGKEGLVDPHEERLSKLETSLEKRDREQLERTQQVERDRVGKVFTDHVEKLSKAAGIAKEDIPFYATQIAALVNGSKAITDRVAKGNFVDIKKFFDTVHNRELQRLTRYNKAQLEKQKNKGKNPKTSAGGSPAASAGQAKRPITSREDRLAAAADMLKGN